MYLAELVTQTDIINVCVRQAAKIFIKHVFKIINYIAFGIILHADQNES